MNEIIKVTVNENGKQIVSARDLYIGLELNKAHWKRWYQSNVIENDYFKENVDWVGFATMVNGNKTQDFAITLEFAKHIAMMARTNKSHYYRNYFIECENKLKDPYVNLSTEMKALLMHDKKIQAVQKEVLEVREDLTEFKEDMPLFTVECEEVARAVKRVGTQVLGGKASKAYKNKSLRAKVYSDIYREIKREFDVNSYKAIKRRYLEDVLDIVEKYRLTIALKEQISILNNQVIWE